MATLADKNVVGSGESSVFYHENVGARIGQSYLQASNWTIPLCRVVVQDRSIKLRTLFGKEYDFSPNDVQKVEKYSGILSRGIKINHSVQSYPPFFVIWSFSSTQFWMSLMKEAGFVVQEIKTGN